MSDQPQTQPERPNPAGWLPFNINHYIRVKFSAASLDLWRKHAEEMRERFPRLANHWPLSPPLDADGFYRGQMWSIMELVAPQLCAGGSAFEDCEIQLELQHDI